LTTGTYNFDFSIYISAVLTHEELNAMYLSTDNIRVVISRRLTWAGHVARMGDRKGAYRALVKKPQGKRPSERPRRRREDYIKMNLRDVKWGGGHKLD
jgi:hypothetical protein